MHVYCTCVYETELISPQNYFKTWLAKVNKNMQKRIIFLGFKYKFTLRFYDVPRKHCKKANSIKEKFQTIHNLRNIFL